MLLHGMPVKIPQKYWFPPALLFIIPLTQGYQDSLYSPTDKPVTRYINSFWSCLKVSLTAKSTRRANNSTLLSQFKLFAVFSPWTVHQWKKSSNLETLYILTILLKFTYASLSISITTNSPLKNGNIRKYKRKYRNL